VDNPSSICNGRRFWWRIVYPFAVVAHRCFGTSYVSGNHGIVPLYRLPTLTDEEREALEWAEVAAMVDAANETDADDVVAYERRAATLRVLRERLP